MKLSERVKQSIEDCIRYLSDPKVIVHADDLKPAFRDLDIMEDMAESVKMRNSLEQKIRESTEEMRRNADTFIHSADEILNREGYQTLIDEELKVEGADNVFALKYEGVATEFPNNISSKSKIEKGKAMHDETFIKS